MTSDFDHTLGSMLRHNALVRGDAPALNFEGRQTNYREFDLHATQVAQGLIGAGLRPGDRACFLSKNCDTVLELAFGCARAGVAVVGINWRLLAEEIAYIIADCGAKALFVCEELFAIAERVVRLLPQEVLVITLYGSHGRWADFDDWRDRQVADAPDWHASPDDVAVLMYTSGTTGKPKGVQLTHRCFFLLHSIAPEGDLSWTHWTPSDKNLVAMPCFHVGGLAYAIWAICGASSQIILREFDPEIVLRTIDRERITRACIVSTAIRFCLNHPSARTCDLSSLRVIQYGASAMSEATLEEALTVFACDFVQNYGMTETTGAATYLPASDHIPGNSVRLASVGKALPGVDITVIRPNGEMASAREVGEICLRSPANMRGYWNMPAATAETLIDGFVHTGDAGFLDTDGYLYIVDRLKDLIVTGGENVSSVEVEHALLKHPAVAEAAVIGLPDARWGEAVTAIVVLRAGMKAGAEEILRAARAQIAAFKCPKRIEFAVELPRNASGKLLKRVLRESYSATTSIAARRS